MDKEFIIQNLVIYMYIIFENIDTKLNVPHEIITYPDINIY